MPELSDMSSIGGGAFHGGAIPISMERQFQQKLPEHPDSSTRPTRVEASLPPLQPVTLSFFYPFIDQAANTSRQMLAMQQRCAYITKGAGQRI